MRHTLRCESAARDAVSDILQAWVDPKHFGGSRLSIVKMRFRQDRRENGAYLGIFAAFEEWSDANESDIVIPQHNIILVVSGNSEDILEDLPTELARGKR